jgi:hypothetical protein
MSVVGIELSSVEVDLSERCMAAMFGIYSSCIFDQASILCCTHTQAAACDDHSPLHGYNWGIPALATTRVVVNGEERFQQNYDGFTFDVLRSGAKGPFYIVTCGRHVGIFNTWCVSSLITDLYLTL